jgi:hypothetical protein
MRLRESEVDQRAVAHVAGDKAVKPSHNTPYAFLIRGDDFAKILWIKPGTKHRRTDQIDEHHCKLPAFGPRLARLWCGRPILLRQPCRERYSARGAEFLAGRIFAAANLAGQWKWRATIATKIVTAADIGPAARASRAILFDGGRSHLQRAHSLRNLRGREVGQAISSPSAEELRHVGRPQYGRLHLPEVNSVCPFPKGASLRLS